MIIIIIKVVIWVAFIYLAIGTLYLFIAALAGRMKASPAYNIHPDKKKIAILIPSYREDAIIVNTARMAKQHNYPEGLFEVFIGADSMKPETIEQLKTLPIQLTELSFERSSKARSLNKLLNLIPPDKFDIALILDADNIMMDGCLESINAAFQQGFRAVQCHRIAKNTNTPAAILDAVSEEINNHLFRRGMRALGLSSITIGSGMAFEFWKLKEIYNKPGILGNPACDREVDFEITRAGNVIEFIDNAIVLDEKVASKEVFERQRTRWLESQVIHLRLFLADKGKWKQSLHYWNKMFINFLLPRAFYVVIFLGILLLAVIEGLTKPIWMFPGREWWLGLSLFFVMAFMLSVPAKMYSFKTFRAVLYAPVLIFSMVRALFKMKPDREEFLHTPKTFSQDVGSSGKG